MPNHVYIATSLDNYIADRTGSLQWLFDVPNPTGSDYGYADFMAGIDAVVMGSGTYEFVLGFDAWPYEKPCYVVSSSHRSAPPRVTGEVHFLSGTPAEIVAAAHARGHRELYIDGGKLITSFLRADLIDELTLSRVPVLLGGGSPLFGGMDKRLQFEHLGTEVFGALIKSRYRRVR
jgi:dihydrofolate reductase